MIAEPLVSIVIPVFNGESHLEACLRSVLSQTYQNIEVVISDQASTDRSLAIVGSFDDPRIRLLPRPTEKLDLHSNWGRALSAAKGEFVKLVCHDDLLLPDCLSIQVGLLQLHPDVALVCGRRRIIDSHDKVLISARGLGNLARAGGAIKIEGRSLARACTRAGANLLGEPASVLIRRSMLPRPLFDPRWSYTIDVEFYLRCLEGHQVTLDNRVICCFRVSPQQLSAVLAKSQAKELRALFSELRHRYPNEITTNDVRIGTVRAQLLAQGRRILYLLMRMQEMVKTRRWPAKTQARDLPVSVSTTSQEPR